MTLPEIDRSQLLPESGIGVVPPWLVIAPPGNPIIRLDLRVLDRVELVDQEATPPTDEQPTAPSALDLVLVCGELEIALYVADGADATRRLAEQAAPLTRDATGHRGTVTEPFLFVGNDIVHQRGDEYIQVGQVAFRIIEVREYAAHGHNLPLTQGRLLQAGMAMLVVAANERE